MYRRSSAVLLTAILLGACSPSAPATPSAPPESPPHVAQTTPSETSSTSREDAPPSPDTESPTAIWTTPAADPTPSRSGGEDESMPILSAGRPLGLDSFFQPDGNWKENRYNVADRDAIQGVTSKISSCQSYGAERLELRLENKFDTFSFVVGQANSSEVSNQTLLVEVIANGVQLDVRRVEYNRLQPFEGLPVRGVGALEIRVQLDPEAEFCGDGSVIAVLHEIRLE